MRREESIGEHGVVALRRRIRGRDDDAAACRELAEERKAGARGVDDDEPARHVAKKLGPFARRQIRTHQVELRAGRVDGAVPKQQHEDDIVARRACLDALDGLGDVLSRAGPRRIAADAGQQDDVVVGKPQLPQRVRGLLLPGAECRGELIAACGAGDDECESILGGRRRRAQQHDERASAAARITSTPTDAAASTRSRRARRSTGTPIRGARRRAIPSAPRPGAARQEELARLGRALGRQVRAARALREPAQADRHRAADLRAPHRCRRRATAHQRRPG